MALLTDLRKLKFGFSDPETVENMTLRKIDALRGDVFREFPEVDFPFCFP
jgi:hypothetical protein